MWEKLFWMVMGALSLIVVGMIGQAVEQWSRWKQEERFLEALKKMEDENGNLPKM